MKRLISLLLAAAMVLAMAGCSNANQVNGDTNNLMNGIAVNPVENINVAEDAPILLDFFLDLSYQSARNGNMLVSPISVLAALAMTANGARGETLTQMESVLGMDVLQLNKWMHSYMEGLPKDKNAVMQMANAIWFKEHESFVPAESFLQANADYYSAGIYQAPFNSATLKTINSWVEENTGGMIRDILDEIPTDAVMYLVNALAFDAKWQTPYDEYQLSDGVFTLNDGTETAVTMMYSEESAYLSDDHAAGFIKYYAGGDYAFAALLPHQMTPGQYLGTLHAEDLYEMLKNPEKEKVYAAIPKFEMCYSQEMSDVLTHLGMTDAFDAEKADFSAIGAYSQGNIFISRVLHKAAITVAEQGTKAGAATAVEMRANGALQVDKTVILDRPFVYMLVDCKNHIPIFIGTMEDPLQTTNQAPETYDVMPILKEPPVLQVYCGDAAEDVMPSSYSWDYYVSEDERSGVEGCGAHPLQMKGYRTLKVSGEEAIPIFAQMPDSWEIMCWDKACWGDPKAAGEKVEITDKGFIPKEGNWIYAITASWNTPQYSGTAEYVFQIEN